MRYCFCLVLTFLSFIQAINAQKIAGFEVWFNEDYTSRQVHSTSGNNTSIDTGFSINTNQLNGGVHICHIRTFDDSLYYSAVLSKLIFVVDESIHGYEFWIDTNYSNKIILTISPGSNYVEIDDVLKAEWISPGIHSLNIRAVSGSGVWSTTVSKYFINLGNSEHGKAIVGYRYWLNADTSTIREVDLSTPVQKRNIFISTDVLKKDTSKIQFTLQVKESSGIWSNLVSDTFKVIGNAELKDVLPKVGGNGGNITLNIYGDRFLKGTVVKLTKSGSPDLIIPDSSLAIYYGSYMRAILDLHTQVDTGLYTLVVEIPGDTIMELVDVFKIESKIEPKIWTQIMGSGVSRPHQWRQYDVLFGNEGNIDANGVPLVIAVNGNTDVEFITIIERFDTISNEFVEIDTFALNVELDSLFGKPFNGKAYPIFISNIAAHSSGRLSMRIKSGTPFEIKAWTYPRIFGSPLNEGWPECIEQLLLESGAVPPQIGCAYQVGKEIYGRVRDAYNAPPDPNQFGFKAALRQFSDYTIGVAKVAATCIEPGAIKSARKGFRTALSIAQEAANNNPLEDKCDPFFPSIPSPGELAVILVTSVDPNIKIGPSGYNGSMFLNSDTKFPYQIKFENDSSASAPAQSITIIDTLDKTVFDLSTFQIGDINLAGIIQEVPTGLSHYESFIDMEPIGQPVLCHVICGIDTNTGIVKWEFQSLGPFTLNPILDPFQGILPPNTEFPIGEGSVNFTISPKRGLSESQLISNKAVIIFDSNAAIHTNNWENVVDKTPPMSFVKKLPLITNDSSFLVEWQGTDNLSGIGNFNIKYSVNNGKYRDWISNTSATSAIFNGKNDSTYAFYSIATDSAGNTELKSPISESVTLVSKKSNIVFLANGSYIKIYPNPASGVVNIVVNGGYSKMSFSLCNLTGGLFLAGELSEVNWYSAKLNVIDLQSGIYFLRFTTETGELIEVKLISVIN